MTSWRFLMSGLRFTRSGDGVLRANVQINFRAGLDLLECAVVFAYENEAAEVGLEEIPQLSKGRIRELLVELLEARGGYVEFIGESADERISELASQRIKQLWPQLADEG